MPDLSTIELMILKFENVMNKYNALEKKPRYYGTKDLLYKSEVHTIEAIGKNSGINVTELAQYLNITKGAVSQMIDKLIKKNLVLKTPVSETEVSLSLTQNGILVFKGHEEYHKGFYGEISHELKRLSPKNLETYFNILNILDKFLDEKSKK